MSDPSFLILAINPGSTSTKAAVFRDEEQVTESTIRHAPEDFADCPTLFDQRGVRMRSIMDMLERAGIRMEDLDAVVGRGGLLKPIESGTYATNEKMLADLSVGFASSHASTLGALLASEIGKKYGIPSFIVDPVVVDELEPVARVSGIPQIRRRSIFHALNSKAVARICAAEIGKKYEECRFVVAHMGGGISVGAHRYGRVVDVNDSLYGEGPFSPERSGGLPVEQLARLCYSGEYSREEIVAFTTKKGGMAAYLGTNDLREVERRIAEGDGEAALIADAMAYQVGKEIGAMAAVLEYRLDGIVLTGGLAHSARFTGAIRRMVEQAATVYLYPGEDEMAALVQGTLRVLRGQESPRVYS